jgi:hypothetical protein
VKLFHKHKWLVLNVQEVRYDYYQQYNHALIYIMCKECAKVRDEKLPVPCLTLAQVHQYAALKGWEY